MKQTSLLDEQVKKSVYGHKIRRTISALVSAAIVGVVGVTSYVMTKPATTATPEMICIQEEHTHGDDCYTLVKNLTCELDESEGHSHTEECFNEEGMLLCEVVESEGHAHGEACYAEDRVLTCEKEEHVHSVLCYEQAGTLGSQTEDHMVAEVSYEAGVIHQGTILSARLLSSDAESGVVSGLMSDLAANQKTAESIRAYDLTLSKDGISVQPDGMVDVTMTFAGGLSKDADAEWKLYHMAEDGSYSELGNTEALSFAGDNTLTAVSFHTTGFSTYVLAAVADEKTTAAPVMTEEETTVEVETKESEPDSEIFNETETDFEESSSLTAAEEENESESTSEEESAEPVSEQWEAEVSEEDTLTIPETETELETEVESETEEQTMESEESTSDAEVETVSEEINTEIESESESETAEEVTEVLVDETSAMETEEEMTENETAEPTEMESEVEEQTTETESITEEEPFTEMESEEEEQTDEAETEAAEIVPNEVLDTTAVDGTRIELAFSSGVLAEGSTLNAVPLEDGEQVDQILNYLEEEGMEGADLLVYDLTIAFENAEIEPNGTVLVTWQFENPVITEIENVWWHLLHLTHEGIVDLTDEENTVIMTNDEGAVIAVGFETDSFSPFALAGTSGELLEDGSVTDGRPGRMMAPGRMNALGEQDGQDFSGWITTVQFEKKNGDHYENTSELQVGDEARVSISYEVPEKGLTGNNIYYQLPEGIRPIQSTSGNVKNQNGAVCGTYVISEDGLITISFDDTYKGKNQAGEALLGTVSFSGKVDSINDGQGGEIQFGGTGNNILTVNPAEQRMDISIAKSGYLIGGSKASYELTVVSTMGTGKNTVKVGDSLAWETTVDGQSPAENSVANFFDENSIVIIRVDKDGIEEVITDLASENGTKSYKDSVIWSIRKYPQFEVTLPPLNAGEKYRIKYSANTEFLNGAEYYDLQNLARTSYEGGPEQGVRNKIEKFNRITKGGRYDSDNNLIYWEIFVNPSKEEDVSNWRIYDELPYPIHGKVHIVGENADYDKWIEAENNILDFTLMDLTEKQKYAKYKITYWTEAPDPEIGKSSVEASNTASVTGGGRTSTAKGEVDVSPVTPDRDLNPQKTSLPSDSRTVNYWKTEITVPKGERTEFSFEDSIGKGSLETGKHYATAKELEKDLKADGSGIVVFLEDNESFGYRGKEWNWDTWHGSPYDNTNATRTDRVTIQVKYYDFDNKQISEPASSDAKVQRFEVFVKAKDGTTISIKKITINKYRTFTESSIDKGDGWSVDNTITVGDKPSKSTRIVPPRLSKGILTSDGQFVFKNGVEISYNEVKGVLTYELILSTEQSDNGKIEVVDTLPDGVEYVDDSAEAFFVDEAGNVYIDNGKGTNFSVPGSLIVIKGENVDSKTLNFVIPEYIYNSDDKPKYDRIAITYKVRLVGSKWKENGTYDLENTAKWNESSTSQTTKVKKDTVYISKTGEQLDGNGNPITRSTNSNDISGNIRYYIEINPEGKELNEGNDLVLTDILNSTVDNDVSRFNPKFDVLTLHLYYYDAENSDHHKGAEVETSDYKMSFDDESYTITLEVKDKTPLLLEYQYSLSSFADGAQVSNSAKLTGGYQSQDQTVLREVASDATVKGSSLTLYKVDSLNQKKVLNGAEFTLKNYSAQVWSDGMSIELGDGKKIFDLLGTNRVFSTDTLYQLTETKSPSGYEIPDTSWYFVVLGDNTRIEDFKKDENKPKDLDWNSVRFVKAEVGILYLENTMKSYTLPESGGPGTNIFRIIGSILLLLAASLFVACKRKEIH